MKNFFLLFIIGALGLLGALVACGDDSNSADANSDADSDGDADADADGDTDTDADADNIPELVTVTDVPITEGVKDGVRNWRIWSRESLHVAPVFSAPLADGGTLVGYTTDSGNAVTARVIQLDEDDQLVSELTADTGFECRGLATEEDGSFGVLIWSETDEEIFVKKYVAAGDIVWTTLLVNPENNPTDFDIGDSRLEFGNNTYGAYYHVHSDSGHEGDTLKWVDGTNGEETTGWAWGCSHSMSNLLRFNPTDQAFLPVCVTDCYPGTSGSSFASDSIGGIYLDHNTTKIMDVDAGCNGSVAGEVGSAALAPSGWKLVFNAHQNTATNGQDSYDPSTMNQDIGFTAIAADMSAGEVVWLTNTPETNEADASIARFNLAGESQELYLVGWATLTEQDAAPTYQLAFVDQTGALRGGPVDITTKAQWGKKDDPFRAHTNGDIIWAWFENPGDTTLHFARVDSGNETH